MRILYVKFSKMNVIEGNIVDVVKGKIFKGRISIRNGKISSIEKVEVDSNHFIIPGFIDSHVHIESSMLPPAEFARIAVCHGTVGTISDPHEIGNVLGKKGVEYMIDNGNTVPFKFYFGVPSCVPATKFETAGAEITLDDIQSLLMRPEVTYLAEMMNFPGVINEDQSVLEKIRLALEMGKVVDGHAPGLRGEDARKYFSFGITTDHECFTYEEAEEKLKLGVKILIREGSAAKNFEALIPLLDQYPDQIMFCSDDKHPNDLIVGHINILAKRAVEKGCDLMNVLRACSKNVIEHYSMDIGLLQVNDSADFCIVEDLRSFKVLKTFIDGELVAENGISKIEKKKASTIINQFNCQAISKVQLKVKAIDADLNVIVVEEGQLITKRKIDKPYSVNGFIESDIPRDILKIVVVNRYFNAPPAIAFVQNFGLKQGAIASSVAHDSHNIIAVGTNDEDLTGAINQLIESKGGISLQNKTEKILIPLPIAGLMSNQDGYEVAEAYEKMDRRTKELGATLSAPYMTLSFCALLVIPELKLSDKGLFDGTKFEFTPLFEPIREQVSSI